MNLALTDFSIPLILIVGICICASLDVFGVSLLKYFFGDKMGSMMKEKPNWVAGLLVWVLLTGGILIFVIPSVLITDGRDAVVTGSIFGLIVYGVYECTNMALLKYRDRPLVFADICRGMVLCSILAYVMWTMVQYLGVFAI